MTRRQVQYSQVMSWLVFFAIGGCGSPRAARDAPREFLPTEVQPRLGRSIVSHSELDSADKYLATVKIETANWRMCSGVLIHPRIVLTAGHCVCPMRAATDSEGGGSEVGDEIVSKIIDKSGCARTTKVRVISHKKNKSMERDEPYSGDVRPHSELRILYNDNEDEIASRADLAIVLLRESVRNIRPVALVEKEEDQVQSKEEVVLIGYGRQAGKKASVGERRFGYNSVASKSRDGKTFLVGSPIGIQDPYESRDKVLYRTGSYALAGDSGGPCLRERDGKTMVVGIAKTKNGEGWSQFSEYTDVYAYVEWLRMEINDSEKLRTR